MKDAQANTVSRQGRTEKALFGRFAPSEIHDRGTLLPFSDSLTRRVLRRTHDAHRFSHPVLRITRHSALFRGSAIVPTISSFLSRALKRCLPEYTRALHKWTSVAHCAECGHRGNPIHRASRMLCQFDTDFFSWSGFPEVRVAPARYLRTCWTRVPACDVILTPAVTQGGDHLCYSP